jgi:signal transduction histidine kinase
MLKHTSSEIKSVFYGRAKVIAIISIVLIISISYSLFFYFQEVTESNVRNSLFVQQRDRQVIATRDLSQHIASDLSLVTARLDGLSNSIYLQHGDLTSNKIRNLMQDNFLNIDNIVDHLFVIDKNDVITIDIAARGANTFVGSNVSQREYVTQAKKTLEPVFSNGYIGLDGKTRIGISYPIIDAQTGRYLGLVAAAVPIVQFFSNYENIDNIQSQFLVAYDKNKDYIATPRTQLLGKNFFANDAQEFFHHNQIQNKLYHQIFAGRAGYAVYDFGSGERLNTGYPVFLSGKPTYFVFIITPTATIYSHVDEALFLQRTETLSLLAGATIAIVLLIVFLIKWSSLSEEVKRRRKELEEANSELETANKQLSLSNEQLKIRDKVQQEFINIAAHELRTPIQPIISLSDILLRRINDHENRPLLDTIFRSAKRLQRLSQDILDITKIESGLLNLNKEHFNLKQLISNTVDDYRNQIKSSNKNIELVTAYGSGKEEETTQGARRDHQQEHLLSKQLLIQDNIPNILIEADKIRITQVIDNLLNNALKFTKEESISVSIECNDGGLVIVSIKDSGQGIDPTILPKLFTKFATKSEKGTGLGLFIAKSIVEAHGGKIWAENNKEGKGATFSFSLPTINK